ncbi:DUF3618 domain-containing protein [Corynebacterium hindlerae]|uniref:DUF3618 domain-containing protein n=1 Tax=Corynebacterium hindlerae TaxID=699041 RepID=UPI001AD71F6C|nr:DUF3618 domain-containing protein [Corynebacterium hindlerae]QTH59381.1 DUF3618 domain-containing protein [Corynebacterium hindlerae]
MARNIDDIQRDIERTRRQLASTLDQLAERSRPQAMVSEAQQSLAVKLQDPKIQAAIGGAVLVVAGLIGLSVANSRKKNRDLKAIQRMLAERS